MGKFCANCGKALSPKAKYCGKCGTKVPQVQVESDSIELSSNSEQSSVQSPVLEIEKANSVTAKESVSKLSQEAKKKETNIMNEVKNLKSLPSEKKKKLLLICVPVLVVIVAVIILIPTVFGGPSDDVISEAALKVAEQDYGYTLTLTSYKIVDQFSSTFDNPLTGKKTTSKIALVIINADANDSNGNTVEEVSYGVVVVDPEKSNGYATCSAMSSCQDCTGMSEDEITEALKEGTASFH